MACLIIPLQMNIGGRRRANGAISTMIDAMMFHL